MNSAPSPGASISNKSPSLPEHTFSQLAWLWLLGNAAPQKPWGTHRSSVRETPLLPPVPLRQCLETGWELLGPSVLFKSCIQCWCGRCESRSGRAGLPLSPAMCVSIVVMRLCPEDSRAARKQALASLQLNSCEQFRVQAPSLSPQQGSISHHKSGIVAGTSYTAACHPNHQACSLLPKQQELGFHHQHRRHYPQHR